MLDKKVIEILQKKQTKALEAFLKKNYPNPEEVSRNRDLIRAIFIPCLYNENPRVVKLVLEYFKLDPNMDLGENNLKPLHLAASSGFFEAIRDLLEAGADPKLEVTLSNKSLANFMDILDAKVHTKTAEKSAQLLSELQVKNNNQHFERNDLGHTEEESSVNTASFSASASLLRKRK